MKLSDMSTDRAFDAMCELTPYINNIVSDKAVVKTIGKVVKPDGPINKYGHFVLVFGRIAESVPLLLKTHRADMYGILSAMNDKTAAEISAQKFIDTMRQAKEIFADEEFLDFFKSFAPPARSAQSAPSAESHAAE